ncbi:MAG: flagellar basal body P-ring formation chaperone FlgA [Chitinispirillales bacterium]|jgi:flagella basal body P-ring formation protein FlgA|nr:flagellar basal body P-ring formation chaperone FlgA [Chitinispirillales bacterium]
MSGKQYSNGYKLSAGALRAALALFAFAFVCVANPVKKMVALHFIDSVMVNDTLIRLGDIAKIECRDAAMIASLSQVSVGEAAPPGFNRFVNTADFVEFKLKPFFKDAQFSASHKRVKVASDFQERRVEQFEERIRNYAADAIGWKAGEWILTINNLKSSWKSAGGPVEVEVSGISNPFAKGNINLLLTTRHGNRINRIPVACHIKVNAPVLIATRSISRGEEFDAQNCSLAVMDITNFAYTPLGQIPEAGTMTAVRTVNAGSILHDRMLKAVPAVARGDRVRITFSSERIKVSVLGVARESGCSGERIWVENSQTGKLVRAAVSGKGSVTVFQEGDRI